MSNETPSQVELNAIKAECLKGLLQQLHANGYSALDLYGFELVTQAGDAESAFGLADVMECEHGELGQDVASAMLKAAALLGMEQPDEEE